MTQFTTAIEAVREAIDSLTDEQKESDSDSVDLLERAIEDMKEWVVACDEEREWSVSEDGHEFATVTASTMKEARREARDEAGNGDYDTSNGTIFATYYLKCELTGETESVDVEIEPDEPECEGKEHDWQTPYEILGGLKDNPGVWGNGGGVIMKQVCMVCGCGKTTDTWAQNPDGGEQGLTSVKYEPRQYAAEVEEMKEAS